MIVLKDEQGAFNSSIIINDACERSVGQTHTLLQPSFPSSGRGWTQKLIFLATDKSAGAGSVNRTLENMLGYYTYQVTGNPGAATIEWLFTHESDRATEGRMAQLVKYPSRPLLVFRVVCSALENVEALYRYMKREGQETGPWDRFAMQNIQRYKKFHRYWDQRCGYNVPAGAAVDPRSIPCCITVTYEDMQGEVFLRRALRKLLQVWLAESGLTAEQIARGADSAVDRAPSKHKELLQLYASGKRYTAAHHLALISALGLGEDGKLSSVKRKKKKRSGNIERGNK